MVATTGRTKKQQAAHERKMEELAIEIRKYLLDKEIWQDTAIYFNGKRFDSYPVYRLADGSTTTEYPGSKVGARNVNYNNPEFLHEEHGVHASQFVEYHNPDTITMTFEGPLYEALNYGGDTTYDDLCKMFNKYGYYFDLGHAWSLALYEN